MKKLSLLLLCLIFVACASATGSVLVSDKSYSPTNRDSVEVIFEKPNRPYKIIGIVKSRGTGAGSYDGNSQLALEELKRQGASIGAHAILIMNSGSQSTAYYPIGGVIFPAKSGDSNMSAKAVVYLDQ